MNRNKRLVRVPHLLRWAGGAALLGIVVAYQPAISQSTGFSLPYTGDATAQGYAVATFTNDASSGSGSDGLYAYTSSTDAASVGVYGSSLGGSGVYGYANSVLTTAGVYGLGDGNSGYGIYGLATNNIGVYGTSSGTNSNGIATAAGLFGTGSSPTAIGVVGSVTSSNPAIMASNTGTGVGLSGSSAAAYGLYGISNGSNNNSGQVTAAGVYGYSATATGVAGVSNSIGNPGIYGYNPVGNGGYGQSDSNGSGLYGLSRSAAGAGVFGNNSAASGAAIGVQGTVTNGAGYGGLFLNYAGSGSAVALQGSTSSTAGIGVVGGGNGGSSVGIYGSNTSGALAGFFNANVQINGTLTASAKNFKIDHPLDPANKYLVHSCIESNEQINLYRGNISLDSNGRAMVEMPAWFAAENGDLSYQLTCVGGYSPVYVDREMTDNRFEIAGGKPGMKVCWQVTGARQDAYAKAHPLQVEEVKSDRDRGKYLDPGDYGKPAKEGIGALPPALPVTPPHQITPPAKQPALLKLRTATGKPTVGTPQRRQRHITHQFPSP